MDLAVEKRAAITKLGTTITCWGRTKGVALKVLPNDYFRVSLGDAGVNWVDDVHIDNIDIGGKFKVASTKNEFVEVEDAGCEGGACKI